MSGKSKGIVTGAVVLTLVIGTLNSIYKKNSLPGFRFFFGSGILYMFLIGIGEFEEEVAKNLAIAIAVFVVLGEGGGMLDHFMGKGTSSTTLNTTPKDQLPMHSESPSKVPQGVVIQRGPGSINATDAAPGLIPVKPVVPNSVLIHPI